MMLKTIASILCLMFFAILSFSLNLQEIHGLSKMPETLNKAVDALVEYIVFNPDDTRILQIGKLVYAKRELKEILPAELVSPVFAESFEDFIMELASYNGEISGGKLLYMLFPQIPMLVDDALVQPSIAKVARIRYLSLISDLPFSRRTLEKYTYFLNWCVNNALNNPNVFDELFARFIERYFGEEWFGEFWRMFEASLSNISESDYPKISILSRALKGRGMVVTSINAYMNFKNKLNRSMQKVLLGTDEEFRNVVQSLPELLKEYSSLKTKKSMLRFSMMNLLDAVVRRIPESNAKSWKMNLPSIINLKDPVLRKKYYEIAEFFQKLDTGMMSTVEPKNRSVNFPIFTLLPTVFLLLFLSSHFRYHLFRIFGFKRGALHTLKNLVAKYPTNPNLHVRLGKMYENLGMYNEASQEYMVAARLFTMKEKK